MVLEAGSAASSLSDLGFLSPWGAAVLLVGTSALVAMDVLFIFIFACPHSDGLVAELAEATLVLALCAGRVRGAIMRRW